MKTCLPLLLFLLTGCTLFKTTESTVGDSVATSNTFDSLMTDSLSYVGFIDRFPHSNEFYTDIYFAENFVYSDYDKVVQLGTNTVNAGEELKRTRIPLNESRQYFRLTGLEKINILDRNNKIVTTGRFKQIEYIEDLIEGRFVAVFDVSDPLIADYKYCIGSAMKRFDSLTYNEVENETLTSALVKQLQLRSEHVWSVHHYEVENTSVLYSAISADTTAYIVESVDQRMNVLYKSSSSEVIHDLVLLPKYISGKPVLLVSNSVPEADISWSSVMIFLGDQYQVSTDHRLRD